MVNSAPKVGPACYAAEYDRRTGDFLLLLEDLSEWRTVEILRPSARTSNRSCELSPHLTPLHQR
ncbi:MAG TPA: hypothetical protein PKD27_15245, partial [Tepidiformaceae bacterium]|nr:hypothetical protein [Tepidiformaceae bacterium]